MLRSVTPLTLFLSKAHLAPRLEQGFQEAVVQVSFSRESSLKYKNIYLNRQTTKSETSHGNFIGDQGIWALPPST
ncbi:hypothetical protein DSO57_1009006 [Entomophthora muscae]|uniref:Uncharacterized protein n=1 Tax=Entomophthora muscae TaxID=34485 RepID=A0ACC2UGU3_9FUNG|nr:hypothetical protein DSO57_1009006 [Entomophthora muscae]